MPQVTTVCRDHEGGWWIGTLTDGIYYRSTPAPWITNVPLTGIRTASRAGKNLLVLGSERDLLLFDTQQRRVVRTLKAGCGKCFDAMSDGQGNVWVSTATGLYRYADGQLVRFDASNCQGLLHSQMRFARGPLPDGRMLVCNLQHYLGLFDPTKKVFTPLNKAFPQLERHRLLTEACALDKDKKRYAVFSQNGMVFLRQEAKHFTVGRSSLDTEKFNCAYRDSKGRIWVGTQNGLLLMRGDGYRRFTQRDGLRNVCINSLAEDGLGQLWIGTAFGIEKLRLTDQDTLFVSYGKAAGMPETLMCERAAAVMPDSKVWMASTEGLVCIEPELLEKSAKGYASKVLLLDSHCPSATLPGL